MQYKIPVQIENEDPIFLWLSLKKIIIIMVSFWIATSLYKGLVPVFWKKISLIPAWIIWGFWFFIAVFKYSEMTFVSFILSLLRLNINWKQRSWNKGVDSFEPIEIGYLKNIDSKIEKKVNIETKLEKLKKLEEKINKI